MKNKFFRVYVFPLVAVFSLFIVANHARAVSSYDQTDRTASASTYGTAGSSPFFDLTGVNTSDSFTKVSVYAGLDSGGCTPTMSVEVLNGSTSLFTSPAQSMSVGTALHEFSLTGVTGYTSYRFYFNISGGGCGAQMIHIDSGSTNNGKVGHWGTDLCQSAFGCTITTHWTDYYPAVIFNGVNPYNVAFGSAYSSGFTSPDFRFWTLLVDAPVYQNNVLATVIWQGNSTSTNGYSGVDNFKIGCCTALSGAIIQPKKTLLLIPGSYTAYAQLRNPDGVLASSSPISFTITATGTPISYLGESTSSTTNPYLGGSSLYNTDWCPDTSFSVWGADFGKGICQVMSFMLVPGQAVFDQFQSLQANIEQRAPFSYFYSVANTLENLNPASTTMQSLTLATGTSTPIRVSFEIFGPSTVNKYTNSTARNVVRSLIEYSLYIAFAAMIIYEVRKLLRGGAK